VIEPDTESEDEWEPEAEADASAAMSSDPNTAEVSLAGTQNLDPGAGATANGGLEDADAMLGAVTEGVTEGGELFPPDLGSGAGAVAGGPGGKVHDSRRGDEILNDEDNRDVTGHLKAAMFPTNYLQGSGDRNGPTNEEFVVDTRVVMEGVEFMSGKDKEEIAGMKGKKKAALWQKGRKPVGWKRTLKEAGVAKSVYEKDYVLDKMGTVFGLPAEAHSGEQEGYGSQAKQAEMEASHIDQKRPRGERVVLHAVGNKDDATWEFTGFPRGKFRVIIRISVRDPSAPSGVRVREYKVKCKKNPTGKKKPGQASLFIAHMSIYGNNHSLM